MRMCCATGLNAYVCTGIMRGFSQCINCIWGNMCLDLVTKGTMIYKKNKQKTLSYNKFIFLHIFMDKNSIHSWYFFFYCDLSYIMTRKSFLCESYLIESLYINIP